MTKRPDFSLKATWKGSYSTMFIHHQSISDRSSVFLSMYSICFHDYICSSSYCSHFNSLAMMRFGPLRLSYLMSMINVYTWIEPFCSLIWMLIIDYDANWSHLNFEWGMHPTLGLSQNIPLTEANRGDSKVSYIYFIANYFTSLLHFITLRHFITSLRFYRKEASQIWLNEWRLNSYSR